MANREVAESRAVAEQARQKSWQGQSFLRELFLGRLRPDLLIAEGGFPGDPHDVHSRQEFVTFYERLERFLRVEVDPGEIDRLGEYPPHVLAGLAQLGA